MFDDRSEFRNFKDEKRLWAAAAAVSKKDLSAWMRETLNATATAQLSALSRRK